MPIRTYSDFWNDYFSSGFQDENGKLAISLENITWPGRAPFYCETSGTTAPSKFIPFSSEMFAENRRAALDLTACYLARNPGSRLFGGKLLYMSGNTDLRNVGYGACSGDMSAITLRKRPFYLRPFVAPDPKIFSLPWDEKVDRMADLLLSDDTIRGISGVPPWILLLLKRCVEMAGKEAWDLFPHLELVIHGGASMMAVPLEEIELNQRYAVILSTCAGLWRYHIGDTLRFISREQLHIEFTGRDRFLDHFEEKVTQGEVEDAVSALNRVPGVEVREFLVGPHIPGRRHVWVLALRQGSLHDHAFFARSLDASLSSQNADYAAFRSQGRIDLPLVLCVDEEGIYSWSREYRGKLGGQSKIPHVDPTPEGTMVRSIVEYSG